MINNETYFWGLGEGWTKDTEIKLNDVNSFKYLMSGKTEDKPNYLIGNHNSFGPNTGAKCIEGEAFTASTYINLGNEVFDGTKPFLGICFYKKNENGALSTISSLKEYINLAKINQWQRVVVSGKALEETSYVKFVVCAYRNGNLNLAQPMLLKGTITTI